eukprot:c8810_g1_i1.p1 GENE.c8810_g1_i1~~c8810_g1_i1.p1  ORF type:complete len:152 (+),score=40.39 c8810_g1_i1:409-864(+)
MFFMIQEKLRESLTFGTTDSLHDSVAVFPLDRFEAKGKVSLLKISVTDDMVMAVIAGAKNTIEANRPVIYASIPGNLPSLLELMAETRYLVWEHDVLLYNHANFRQNDQNELNFRIGFVVCIPEEKLLTFPELAVLVDTSKRFRKLSVANE